MSFVDSCSSVCLPFDFFERAVHTLSVDSGDVGKNSSRFVWIPKPLLHILRVSNHSVSPTVKKSIVRV